MTINVMIKENGEYFTVPVSGILRGLRDEGEPDEHLIQIPMSNTIKSIRKSGGDYIVTLQQRGINREIGVGKSGGVASLLEYIERKSGITVHTLRSKFSNGGMKLMYNSPKGVEMQIRLRKEGDKYRVKKEETYMAREGKVERDGEGLKLIYPNVYNDTRLCWGNTTIPTIKDFSEIGKVVNTFFTSYTNNDLASVTVSSRNLEGMLTELMGMSDRLPRDVRGDMTRVVMALRNNEVTGRNVSWNVYLLILLTNLYDLDIDWMQNRLWGN